jgi:hypothetical protein
MHIYIKALALARVETFHIPLVAVKSVSPLTKRRKHVKIVGISHEDI